MRNLARVFVGLCILSIIAVDRLNVGARPRGRLAFHWTSETFQQAYRLQGRYMIWGLTNGSISTLQSPLDAETTSIALDPGLYGVQLEPGACIEFQRNVRGLTSATDERTDERCTTTALAPIIVIVEPGRQRDIEFSLHRQLPDRADAVAEARLDR
jgi:hypothetical protein